VAVNGYETQYCAEWPDEDGRMGEHCFISSGVFEKFEDEIFAFLYGGGYAGFLYD